MTIGRDIENPVKEQDIVVTVDQVDKFAEAIGHANVVVEAPLSQQDIAKAHRESEKTQKIKAHKIRTGNYRLY